MPVTRATPPPFRANSVVVTGSKGKKEFKVNKEFYGPYWPMELHKTVDRY